MASIKRSFFWSAIENLGPRVLQISVSIILARLLDPSVFGLVGMLALFMALAQVFGDSGFTASLVQKKVLTEDDEKSIFILNIAAGIFLAAIMCLISPLVARFYEQPVLMPMLCAQSLSIVISSFCLVQTALLQRSMQFKKTATIRTASTISGAIIGVLMAYFGFGVWSLVVSLLSASAVQMVLLWSLSDWRPKGKVRLECIRRMWSFSSYLLYCNLIGVAYQNLYTVIIGKFYSPTSLGYYDRANNLRMLPAGIMTGIVNRVAFPLFSRSQDDKPLLLKRIREIVRGTLFLSAGCLTLLAVMADPLVPFLMSEKWRPAIPLLRILCYAGVLAPVHALYLMALQAQGYSKQNFRLECIKMVNGIVAVYLVYPYGVKALAWSFVVLTGISYFLNAYYNVKLLRYQWRMQAWDILPTFCLCAIAGSSSWWLGISITSVPVITILVQTISFTAICAVLIFSFRKSIFNDIWKHLVWGIGRLWLKIGTSTTIGT